MTLAAPDASPLVVGTSTASRQLDAELTAAARSSAKVLLTGESGAGKEIAARVIHERSPRRHMPLVTINCAGVPDTLLESELFGHVKGSFTGAYRDKPGLFETANGGTVFLDEIGEMSLRMQGVMLRFLETGEVARVGDEREPLRVNVRVICATNRHLPERITAGEFREDLYYRLNVVHVHVPALRDRREDLPALIEQFISEFAHRHHLPALRLEDETLARLFDYEWPGNVRELRNVIERLVVRGHGGSVKTADLPLALRVSAAPAEPKNGNETPLEAYSDALARDLYRKVTLGPETFWQVVHDPFMLRDVTRDVLRRVITLGLEQTGGHYSGLGDLFRLRKDEVKKLMNFLRKHQCLVSLPTTPSPAEATLDRPDRSQPAEVA
jgi:transcriptional regulator with PAS, ATPase and Fis domain